MNSRSGHFPRLSNLRWRSSWCLTTDPPVCLRFWFSHYLPNIATNAYRRVEAVTVSVEGLFHTYGAAGSSPGAVGRSRSGRIARR